MAKRPRLRERGLGVLKIGSSTIPPWRFSGSVESFLSPQAFEDRLRGSDVAPILEAYQGAGGDLERLKVALWYLVPEVVKLPPSRRQLQSGLKRCITALEQVLSWPGPVMGKKECEEAKRHLEFLLRSQVDQDAYYRYWGPDEEPQDRYDRILAIGKPPVIRTGKSGRRRGSTIGMLLAVLAREFTLRFGGPRWNDLSAIVGAVTDRDFIPEIIPQTLMVRARPYKTRCETLHRCLFEQ